MIKVKGYFIQCGDSVSKGPLEHMRQELIHVCNFKVSVWFSETTCQLQKTAVLQVSYTQSYYSFPFEVSAAGSAGFGLQERNDLNTAAATSQVHFLN